MGRLFNTVPSQQPIPLKVNPPISSQQTNSNVELIKYKEEIENLKAQNQALVAQTQQALEQYKTRFGELTSEKRIIVEQSEKEINNLKQKLNESVLKNKNIASRSEKAISYFRQKLASLLEQYKNLEQKSKESSIKLQNALTNLTKEKEELTRQKEEENKKQETKIAELTAQNETLIVESRVLQTQVDDAKKQMEELNNTQNQKLGEMSFRNQELTKQYEVRLQEFAAKSQETINAYQSRIDAITAENQQLLAQINAARQQIGQIQQTIPSQPQFIQPPPTIQQPQPFFIPPSFQPPPTPLWANIEKPPQMPIAGERRFEISEDLKKRLKPLQTQAEIPVAILKSTFGIGQQPIQPPVQQSTTQPPINSEVDQNAQKENTITSEVQVLISQLAQLQNEAQHSEIGKEEFEKRLSATLKTVGNLTKEEPTPPPPQPVSSPAADKRVTELAEKNKQLLEQVQGLKGSLEDIQKQAQMTEKEKESFRQKLAESIKALSRAATTKEESKEAVKDMVKIEQEEIEPETQKVKLVKRRVTRGSIPPLTNTPNVINGIVKDARGVILSDIIIVVKDSEDNSVRALKTNKLGQFAISTPLPNGTYIVEMEKEGYKFDIIQIEVMGEVLPPLEIRSQN